MEKKQNKEMILEKKDRSIPFLIGAAIFFVIAAIMYNLVVAPMLVKMDLYQQAVGLYDCGEYAAANKLFLRLGNYKDSEEKYWEVNTGQLEQLIQNEELNKANKLLTKIQEQNKNPNGETAEKIAALQKKINKLSIRNYIKENFDTEYVDTSQFWYHDMDGDGSLECCQIREDGLKTFYTYKDGAVTEVESVFWDSGTSYIFSRIFEKNNIFLVMKLDSEGIYRETFYKLSDTSFVELASQQVEADFDTYEEAKKYADCMHDLMYKTTYSVNQFSYDGEINSREYWVSEAEDVDAAEFEKYIAEITEGAACADGVNSKLNEWEKDEEIGQEGFAGNRAYYGGENTFEAFCYCIENSATNDDDYDEDDYDDYDEDNYDEDDEIVDCYECDAESYDTERCDECGVDFYYCPYCEEYSTNPDECVWCYEDLDYYCPYCCEYSTTHGWCDACEEDLDDEYW